jgi:hypothetical protein
VPRSFGLSKARVAVVLSYLLSTSSPKHFEFTFSGPSSPNAAEPSISSALIQSFSLKDHTRPWEILGSLGFAYIRSAFPCGCLQLTRRSFAFRGVELKI